ncbi:MAG: hypothetical protein WBC92_01355, partial [Terracidiphilus sp.]
MKVICALAMDLLVCGVLMAPGASAQTALPTPMAEPKPSFEVATIKPSNPDDRGRRLHPSADRITIEKFHTQRADCLR